MKAIQTILGLVLLLVGILWILQGFNIVGGSFMSGQSMWAATGTVALIAGAILLVLAYRPRARL